MSNHSQQQQLERHVRALYNYNVGQKAGAGWVILVVFILGALVYASAYMFSMFSAIAHGLAALP